MDEDGSSLTIAESATCQGMRGSSALGPRAPGATP